MNKKEQKLLIKILLATLLLIISSFVHKFKLLQLAFYLLAYLLVGGQIVRKALRNLIKGQIFDENFLMSIATIGAFMTGEYLEGVLVMLLYQIGELFQSYAVGKSRKSIANLMDIRPDYANIEKDGKLEKVDPEDIKVGDTILVKAGEKIPLDGIVIKGTSSIDTSALTGEPIPKKVEEGSSILSGCINKTGLLTIEVTKEFEESTVSKILDLVENASSKKAKTENFITKFARYYTPVVVILALCLTFLPPLFIKKLTILECLKRAMTFLVISCPCALVISVPLGFFGGIGGASKKGILIKGSNYLEALSKVETIVFDKTGTLTKGTFEVTTIVSSSLKKEELLSLAAHAEAYSTHPIAESIKKAYTGKIHSKKISNIEEIAGNGIIAKIEEKEVAVGNQKLMDQLKITYPKTKSTSTIVYIAIDKQYEGYLSITDQIKKEAPIAIQTLRKNGINNLIMLTGDNQNTAEEISKKLNLNEYCAQLLPTDKVDKIEKLLTKKRNNTNLAFVGDGINDAPVLTRADIGIAMGGLGSDAAIEAADIVIMDDNLTKISTAISLSKRTIHIVKQNIYFAIGIKIFFLLLGTLGLANMMEAVFADVGVSILAILNSMRALKSK